MFSSGHDATNHIDNPLWLYSIEQYKKPGCADFLLHAQDNYALDLNILLFIGWLVTQKKCYDESRSMQWAHAWQAKKVIPIRQVRQRAKRLSNLHFYEAMKQLELSSEHAQQALLFNISEVWPVSELSRDEIFESSLKKYAADKPLLEEKSWLQALYKHLQP
jgi:uncharacterized protein (TIGR02444 family)